MPYAAQLASKQERCAAALAEVAPALTWLPAVAGPDSASRNKAKALSLQDEPERSLSASSTTPGPALTSESLEESAVRDVIYSRLPRRLAGP